MPTSMYIPSWKGAAGPAVLQVILIGFLFLALMAYCREGWNVRISAFVLACGIFVPTALWFGLTEQIEPVLNSVGSGTSVPAERGDFFISFFELYRFGAVSFVGLVVAFTGLFIFRPPSKHMEGGENQSVPVRS